MLPKVLLFALAIFCFGDCQKSNNNPPHKCGVSLILENTVKKRLGQIPYSAETVDGESPKRRTYTAAEMHPWVVSFGTEGENKTWNHVCGGSIISSNHVLTAHHCVKKIGDNGFIRAGDSDLRTTDGDEGSVQMVKVSKVSIHPFRDPESRSAFFDLAVLTVDPPFKFTDSVRHICLPDEPKLDADDREGEGVTVAGYGETSVGQLLSTMVTIRPESFCKKIYESESVNTVRENLSVSKPDAPKPMTDKQDAVKNGTIQQLPNEIVGNSTTVESNSTTVDIRSEIPSTQDETKVKRDAQKNPASVSNEQKLTRFATAARIVPNSFNTSLMCIGSEIGGIGACDGDDGGPGYVFDTGDGLNEEKFVQLAVFHGSVECGLASFPDIYVRLEEPQTLEFVRRFVSAENYFE